MDWWFGFRGLVLLLGSVGFMMSCGGDSAGVAPAVGQVPVAADPAAIVPAPTRGISPVAADPAAIVPTPTRGISPVAAGEMPLFPRHDKAIPANRGNQYVYGELSLSGDCLRISYVDQADREGTRDGLLVVWPAGFGVQTRGDVVVVTGADGDVVASVGQTLRLSGSKRVSLQSAAVDQWNWNGADAGQCSGPFWLVGDEVSATASTAADPPSDAGIFFPRLGHQRGPIVSSAAGGGGTLVLRDSCLVVETAYSPGAYLVVWPPGFSVQKIGGELLVLNGGGSVIAQVGDDVRLSGRSSKPGVDYSDECPGAYFKAYSVKRFTAPTNEPGA